MYGKTRTQNSTKHMCQTYGRQHRPEASFVDCPEIRHVPGCGQVWSELTPNLCDVSIVQGTLPLSEVRIGGLRNRECDMTSSGTEVPPVPEHREESFIHQYRIPSQFEVRCVSSKPFSGRRSLPQHVSVPVVRAVLFARGLRYPSGRRRTYCRLGRSSCT